MIRLLRDWRRRRILARSAIPEPLWRDAYAALPLLRGLDAAECSRLRELATLFLHAKRFKPMEGLELDDAMLLDVALQAALPILNLGLDWYRGWRSIIVYPDEFVTHREETDGAGVVHIRRESLSGETWDQGGVVLSWADVAESGWGEGYNVVIHEMAHKLDLLNGDTDGFPPLHRGMLRTGWTEAFESAFADLGRRVQAGEEPEIDPYAAESPGECFAVFSEYFFEQPALLYSHYCHAYEQLALFYRQDPRLRQRL